MTSILYQLFRPWGYLAIRHESKYLYDYVIPGFMALATGVPLMALHWCYGLDVYSKSGLIKDLVSFLSILPGFFIAALAAIATFQKNDIDELMPSPTSMHVRQADGSDIDIQLTRRRFLCALFAYLAAQTILVCVAFLLIVQLAPVLSELLSLFSHLFVKCIASFGIFLFMFSLWQLLSSTALGLYYLGDRLHHPA